MGYGTLGCTRDPRNYITIMPKQRRHTQNIPIVSEVRFMALGSGELLIMLVLRLPGGGNALSP